MTVQSSWGFFVRQTQSCLCLSKTVVHVFYIIFIRLPGAGCASSSRGNAPEGSRWERHVEGPSDPAAYASLLGVVEETSFWCVGKVSDDVVRLAYLLYLYKGVGVHRCLGVFSLHLRVLGAT